MPHVYEADELRSYARIGRQAMMLHPDWRNRNPDSPPDWSFLAVEMIANILHGLNSRVDINRIQSYSSNHQGIDSILVRALMTYRQDYAAHEEGGLTESSLV